ncbi:hypothetical protein [Kitasatospora sp. NPDC056184]|uniref:hypothetical protein n=1 Tax=Kitasatospora sp. NPDC056184 TaxID=3345738 RepID=UPI0035D6AEDB
MDCARRLSRHFPQGAERENIRESALEGLDTAIDVRDDAQFELLLDLVPHTIHTEGQRADRLVFSAGDSGTSLCIAVTQDQEM